VTSPELVSALVPAYNHAGYVRECLDALAAQTHRPLELLVGDDASTDRTADVIRDVISERGDAFERVVFVQRTVNEGMAAMLNELLARARGRYLFLNASDDRAAVHAIDTLATVLDDDPRAALAVGDSIIIDASGRRVYWGPHREIVEDESDASYLTWVAYLRAFNRPGVFDPALFGRPGTLHRGNYIPNGKLFRRAAVERVGGWRPGTYEDWDLNFRLSLHYRLRYVDEPVFAYRWHDENTIRNPQRVVGLQAGTEASIAREMRNPAAWLRVAVHRDYRSGLAVRLRRGRPTADVE
jgi:alpha-1,3-rhamnosyltransferase